MSENEQKAGCVDAPERADGPIFADTTIATHVAFQAYGPRYGVDWVYHDDRLGYLPALPVKTREELRAALEAAALSPARSGEAVAWRVSVAGDWFFSVDRAEAARERNEYEADCDGDCDHKEPEPLYLAPRNESSGVSPGGGEEKYAMAANTGPLAVAALLSAELATPAPQDSVRVGDDDWSPIKERTHPYMLHFVNSLIASTGWRMAVSHDGEVNFFFGAEPFQVLIDHEGVSYYGKSPSGNVLRGSNESSFPHFTEFTTPAPAAGADGGIWRDDPITAADIDKHLESMAEEYEFRGDDSDYTPNSQERMLLIDFAHGIMADDVFLAMAKTHFAGPWSAALSDGAGQSAGGGE